MDDAFFSAQSVVLWAGISGADTVLIGESGWTFSNEAFSVLDLLSFSETSDRFCPFFLRSKEKILVTSLLVK